MYAGAPLSAPGDEKVGTLCIIDDKSREFTRQQLSLLRDLADCVERELFHHESQQTLIKIRDNEQHLQAVLHNVIDGIITINHTGIIQEANPATETIFGYQLEEMLGQNIKMLMPSDIARQHDGYLQNFQTGGKAKIIGIGREVMGKRKSGETFPLDLAISGIRRGNKNFFVGLVRDITERKKSEKALVKAKEEAEQSTRMKSEFINMMSHELRTPLTVILGYLPLLNNPQKLPPAEVICEIIEDIKVSGNHLLHLINDLLDLSKIEADKMELHREWIDINDIISGILANVQQKATGKNIELINQVTSCQLYVDPVRIRQIIYNLLGNALKFTEQGSVKISSSLQSGMLAISVQDTGMGIKEIDLPTIFDKFHQIDSSSKRKASGTGLGLAITQKLVEIHGGTIEVNSRFGEGTEFIVTLPIKEQ